VLKEFFRETYIKDRVIHKISEIIIQETNKQVMIDARGRKE
jgi:hypothetical protein